MAESKYDMVVIGSGPGGYVAAIRAAQLGMKTAVVERADVVGGRCLNEACIPAKAILRVADVFGEVNEAEQFGIKTGEVSFDFGGATTHRDKVIKQLTGGVAGLFKNNKIDVIKGHGSLTDDGNVKVGGTFDGDEIEAGKVILATGSVPKPILGLEFGERIVDTAGMWLGDKQPKRLAVIGAGASGTEVASAFGRLGTEVVLIEALTRSSRSRTRTSRAPPRDDEAELRDRHRRERRVGRGHRRGREAQGQRRGRTRSTCSASPPAAAPTSRASGLDEAGVEARRTRPGRGRRRDAHLEGGRLRHRRPRARPRARPQELRRGRHRRRGRGRARHPADRLPLRPARDLLLAAGRLASA